MKNLSNLIPAMLIFAAAVIYTNSASQAAEVGDILYHDGTFDKTVLDDKVPIGVVFWVSDRRDHGYVLTLEQPAKMAYSSAISYCNSYKTLGTSAGDWKLPNAMEILRMGNERINGVANTKFNTINAKLKTIPNGQELLASQYYWIESRGYGLTYLDKYGFTTSTDNAANMYYPRCVKGF